MKTRLTLSLLALFTFVPAALAQEGPPQPGPQHKALAMAEGVWDAKVEGMGPEPATGTSTMKMVLGGFWLEDTFSCDFGGMKFEGRGMTGYDPIKGKYVGTWTDNMSPALMVTEGTYDEKTRTLTMVGDGYDQTGAKVKMRLLTIHKDANTVVFEMHQTGADGKEAKMMTITYTRHVEKPAGKPAQPMK
ncbi:MAG: DUF1579 domain-containing protein [Planctomycetes bacterium]|nr:DUF1579 domain-containing protein [Planctomycetota bacterium]